MSNTSKEIKDKYIKLDPVEHVLLRPNMYIGSIQKDKYFTWTLDDTKDNNMIKKEISYIPGFYKIYDELLVNILDHMKRIEMEKRKNKNFVKTIKVNIDIEENKIEVYNDGDGIDIDIHPEHNVYIPELIFGNMLTSTNYDEEEEKIIGGMNGIGAKACNIFSKKFILETVDAVKGLKYTQEFENNMNIKNKPKIKKYEKHPYTRITFYPDLEKFKLEKIDDNMFKLMQKRVYDICGLTDETVKVYFNDKKLDIKNFQNYSDLYLDGYESKDILYEKVNDRWEIIVTHNKNSSSLEQVSFVNGIWTLKGGKHVDNIVNQVIKNMTEIINKKNKDLIIRPQHIRDNLFVFIKSVIVNPSFDSQTKETLTTPVSKFGSKCNISNQFFNKLYNTKLIENVIELSNLYLNKSLKKNDGKKKGQLRGIPKLDDAIWAGTNKSEQCTLILTEGDSAKSMAIAGLSVVGRDNYGVFPLKGKLLNVLDITDVKITNNEEITNIKKIIGLETGKKYINLKSLRYGKIMVMTDQDVDGSHIKGLLFNLFNTLWPSLIKIDGFMNSMLTPIIKAKKKNNVKEFYNLTEYENWRNKIESNNTIGKWNIKYYKGLGTSTEKEAKEYFRDIKNVEYIYDNNESKEKIDLAFNKKRADDRKDWLYNYNKQHILDYNDTKVNYEDFINKDLIHFSVYDTGRSLPSFCDGLKISTRKILYSCFKRNLIKEVRVAQLAGYVSENANYHHGEKSLQDAIVGMAQTYIGSNNINLLMPNGQFGCLDPETPIILWDSSIKKATNIKVNDKLIGDDGKPRIVSKLISGEDDMYEIKNGNMDNYIVNSNHILTIYYSGHKSIFWKDSTKSWMINYFDDKSKKVNNKSIRTNQSTTKDNFNSSKLTKEEAYKEIQEFSENISNNNIFDINLQQYLKLSECNRQNIKGVLNNSVIKWNEQKLDIDPYILGSWLGNGYSDNNIAKNLNPFKELLKKNNLYKNKHIPHSYIFNSEENRLKLLAGMIDTDCSLKKIKDNIYRYEIYQSEIRKDLLEQFRIIAGSLGFRAKIYITKSQKNINTMYTLEITGINLNKIPVKLSRKKILEKQDLSRNAMTHHIDVEYVGKGDFCGWEIDGNERFLLADFTITHNTRLQGGKDSASPRYIHTELNSLTMTIYNKEDLPILNYLDDDGDKIEPEFYLPVIPMVLINGLIGIGTGFSCNVPCYNPLDLIKIIKKLLKSDNDNLEESFKSIKQIKPYYSGHKGNIKEENNKYFSYGKFNRISSNQIEITELPIGTWTQDYKDFLEKTLENNTKKIKDYESHYTESNISFILTFEAGVVNDLLKSDKDNENHTKFEKEFKLITSKMLSTTNMHMFNENGAITKMKNTNDIIEQFYTFRLSWYQKRKDYIIDKLNNELIFLDAKIKFILDIIEKKLEINNRKKSDIEEYLEKNEYPKRDNDSYDYLIKMSIWNLTYEKKEELLKELNNKKDMLSDIEKKTIEDMWLNDLEIFEKEYKKYIEQRLSDLDFEESDKKSKKKGSKVVPE